MLRATVILLCLTAPVTAQEFFTLKGHGGPIMDIAVAPSGQIATASFDNSVGVWNDQVPLWLDGHTAAVNKVAFWSDQLAVSAGDDFDLILWNLATSQHRTVKAHQGKIADIALHPDGRKMASASWDGTIGLWTIAQDGAVTGRMLEGHEAGVNAVAFNGTGDTVYSASADGTIRSWQDDGFDILVRHGFGINEMIVNTAEGWLAYGAVDGGTRLIDLDSGTQIADFTLERRPILALAHHAPSGQLAVGDGEGYIMVIDTDSRRITRDFRATQRGPIWALAFSPDGQNIHAGGIEDIVYSWPIATMDAHGQMASTTRSFLQDPATLPNGERQFKRKCSICHSLTPGTARRAGPTLYGLFGRRSGTVPDYTYSATLQDAGIIWSGTTIDALFDTGPDHYIPGSKMPMQRIAKPADRTDLITYLRAATAPSEN